MCPKTVGRSLEEVEEIFNLRSHVFCLEDWKRCWEEDIERGGWEIERFGGDPFKF